MNDFAITAILTVNSLSISGISVINGIMILALSSGKQPKANFKNPLMAEQQRHLCALGQFWYGIN